MTSSVELIHKIAMQRANHLLLRRMDDGWLVWLAGSAGTHRQTYLYLYDSGEWKHVTETDDEYVVLHHEKGT